MPDAQQRTTVSRRRLTSEELDELPLGTFLILSRSSGTPVAAMRLVKPNNPDNYGREQRTPGERLLYHFWSMSPDSKAVKRLGLASRGKFWRWVVEPGQPGYELLEAFKIVCDTKRGLPVRPLLLFRALGYEPTPSMTTLIDELT